MGEPGFARNLVGCLGLMDAVTSASLVDAVECEIYFGGEKGYCGGWETQHGIIREASEGGWDLGMYCMYVRMDGKTIGCMMDVEVSTFETNVRTVHSYIDYLYLLHTVGLETARQA